MQFKNIHGQEKIKKQLIQTVKDNRVSHAQLFFGPEGSGKLALAIAYAQFISCTNKQENDSCGVCSSCIKYNKLIHPDLHFFYPNASNNKIRKPRSKDFIKQWRELLIENDYNVNLNQWYEKVEIERKQAIINVEDCHEIIRTLSLKTYESEFKIIIIWMVEKLFHAAAPRILKNLEEPPEKTLFILITENYEKILSTISSRTQLIKIPKFKKKDISNFLKAKFDEPENVIYKASNLADGNIINAIDFLNNSEKENFNFIKFREFLRLTYSNDFIEINKFVVDIAKISREKQKHFISYGLKIVRNCILKNNNPDLVKTEGEELKFLNAFHPFINSTNYLQFNDELNEAFYHIERNGNSQIIFMDLALTFTKYFKILKK